MFRKALAALALSTALGTPAFAQFEANGGIGPSGGFGSSYVGGGFGGSYISGGSAGAAGVQRRDTDGTGAQAWQGVTPDVNTGMLPTAYPGQTFTTGKGSRNAGDFRGPLLPPCTTTQFGVAPGTTVDIDNLPRTSLSSLIDESGRDENIYSNEGTTGLPPLNGFFQPNTIGAGMVNPGLSTGHASPLPSSWLETGR